jgi:acetolactate synthase-1/2/3 large subunit
MKLSNFVADFLAKLGIGDVFGISGGASLHLLHSIDEHPNLNLICPLHEQSGAMAADGYSRITRNIGVAIATSGPGATNMITGICCSYYDSVPVLFITGQVATFRFKGDTGVRQYGFQETDIVSICNSITKYAVTIKDPNEIKYELEKAIYIARNGRPGPVLIDIPDNLQRYEIDPNTLVGYSQDREEDTSNILEKIKECIPLIYRAQHPVIIFGWGVRLACADSEANLLIKQLGFPVLLTWGMADFLHHDHENLIGTFGTHGTRYGNFAVQNADLIITVGTRLDTHETGSPLSDFARDAIKIVVDIDSSELNKASHFGMTIEYPIEADAKLFISTLAQEIDKSKLPNIEEWKDKNTKWKSQYSICPNHYYKEKYVNPYVFVKDLSAVSIENDIIFVDTGCSIAWMMQAFEFKSGQRLFHDFNNTAMGYALPASIGASIATGRKPVTCITGDGSLQMNIQELATAIHYEVPLRIIVLNNRGYSMIQQTQDQWLDSNYVASSPKGGVPIPDFISIAKAYGYKTFSITKNSDIRHTLETVFKTNGPVFCEVNIKAEHRVIPQVKFGRPLEDADPLLDRYEFKRAMITPLLDISK